MSSENKSLSNFVDIIDNLARLHEWEAKNFPLLNSLTGRILYYRIAQNSFAENSENQRTMKHLTSDSGFTEKSLRIRLNLMEAEGFIECKYNENDARTRFPIPTDKFFAAMYLHSSQAKRILGEDFVLIKK